MSWKLLQNRASLAYETLRGCFAAPPSVAARSDASAALGLVAPGGRPVARAVVQCPVALGAGLESVPSAVLLCRDDDREQDADRMIQPVGGGEQRQPVSVVDLDAQAHRSHGSVKGLGGLED